MIVDQFMPTSIGENAELDDHLIERLLEDFAYDEGMQLPSTELKAFVESQEAEVLVEANKLNRKTLVRLSKKDDAARRTTIAAFELAREHKDPLWTKLVKNRVQERKLIAAIEAKYGNKAERVASVAQREYIKKQRFPISFKKAGGADRLSS